MTQALLPQRRGKVCPLALQSVKARTTGWLAALATLLLSACGGPQTTQIARPDVVESTDAGWSGARAYALGAEALDSRNYPAAVVAFTWAIEEAPDRVEPWLNRAIAYIALRRFSDADADIEVALRLAPTHRNVLLAAASRAVSTLRYDQALALLDQAQPDGEDVALLRGWALAETGQVDEAESAFRRAIADDTLRAAAHCGLARVAEHRGQLDLAIAAYRTALTLEPSNRTALRGLGLRSLDAGDAVEARRAFDSLLRELPEGDPDRTYIEAARSRAR